MVPAAEGTELDGRDACAQERNRVGCAVAANPADSRVEGSGGVAVPKWTRWFDGFASMGLVLECMARRKTTLAELAAGLPRYHMIKGSIPSSSERIYPLLEAFRKSYHSESPNLEDGVRVDWKDAWLHIRASNTEPLIRIIVEAENLARARELYDLCYAQVQRLQTAGGA